MEEKLRNEIREAEGVRGRIVLMWKPSRKADLRH